MICVDFTTVVTSHKHESVTKQSLFELYELMTCSTDLLQQVGTPAQVCWHENLVKVVSSLTCVHPCVQRYHPRYQNRQRSLDSIVHRRVGSFNLCTGHHYITVSYRGDDSFVHSFTFLFRKCPISKCSHFHSSHALILFPITAYPAHRVYRGNPQSSRLGGGSAPPCCPQCSYWE